LRTLHTASSHCRLTLRTAGSHSTLPAHTPHCRLALPAHTPHCRLALHTPHCRLALLTPHCQLTLPAHTSHCRLTLPAHTAGSHSTLPADTAACVRLVLFQLRVRSATGSAAARRRAVADLSKRTRRAATVRSGCRHLHPQCAQPRVSADGGSILPAGQVRDYSRRPRLTRARAPARGWLLVCDSGGNWPVTRAVIGR
jgi:hypothetical protein